MRWLLIGLLFLPCLAAQTAATVYGAGLQPPANNVAQGQVDLVMLGFAVIQVNGATPVNFTACSVSNLAPVATAAGAADTVRVRLMRDLDNNFTVSTGDTVAAEVVSPGFPVSLSGFSDVIPTLAASTFSIYMVVVDIETTATINRVYDLELTTVTTNAAITQGAPMDGNPQTIVAPSTAEIDVQRYNNSIPVGGSDPLGGMQNNVAGTVVWTIHNTGAEPLLISLAYLPDAAIVNCNVTISQAPAASVPIGGTTTVAVSVTPTALGQPFGFILAINNNDADENPYTVVATGTSTAGPGAATQLTYNTQPGNGVAGMPLTAQPVLTARDSGGQVDTSFTGAVTASITPATGTPGAALTGTFTVNAIAGVATFTNLGVDLAGTGYRLSFSAGAAFVPDSAQFNVTPQPATQLVVTMQPGGALAGVAMTSQPVIEARSAGGQLDTAFTGQVSASISVGTGTGGASLSGTAIVAAVGGIATFTDLSIDLAGTGYTLTFSSAPLSPAVSAAFDVASAAATQLVIALQPGDSTGGLPFAPQPVVEARSAGGIVDVSFTGNVNVEISAGTGTAGATLTGTISLPAVAGIASFTDLAIDLAGMGYTLTFSSGALTAAVSNPLDVSVGAPAAVRLATQPTGAIAGSAFVVQPVVELVDAGGNLVASDNTTLVTAAIASGPSGALLLGTNVQTVSGGIASFTGLGIDTQGTFTLQFVGSVGGNVTSAPIIVSAPGSPPPGNGNSGSEGCAGGSGGLGVLSLLILLWRRRRND